MCVSSIRSGYSVTNKFTFAFTIVSIDRREGSRMPWMASLWIGQKNNVIEKTAHIEKVHVSDFIIRKIINICIWFMIIRKYLTFQLPQSFKTGRTSTVANWSGVRSPRPPAQPRVRVRPPRASSCLRTPTIPLCIITDTRFLWHCGAFHTWWL